MIAAIWRLKRGRRRLSRRESFIARLMIINARRDWHPRYHPRKPPPAVFVPLLLLLASLATATLWRPAVAIAHPHVFVTTREVVVFSPEGQITGIKNAWTFDDFYTSFLEQGLDKGPDGRYSRETLHELAKTNTEGLVDANYFTFIKANGRNVKFSPPKEYWLEDDGKNLTLHFTLPLAEPVKPKSFVMRIYDPSYFVAFDPAEGPDVVKLEGQQPGCSLLVRKPAVNVALKQQLSQLDVTQQPNLEDAGAAFADSILVACP
jgi:ABC-type uncharacterized transport system substrate-binding protein